MIPRPDAPSFERVRTAPFRSRLGNRERLVGTFITTTSPHGVEVLGRSGLDTYEALGVTLFLIGSDQTMLRVQGAALATHFRR